MSGLSVGTGGVSSGDLTWGSPELAWGVEILAWGGITENSGGLSVPPGLSPSSGLSVGNGLSFPGFGGVTPVVTNGILQEGSLTDFIMMENGTDYIIQE